MKKMVFAVSVLLLSLSLSPSVLLAHKAGIKTSFPQRDVHLDIARPLDVRLVTTTQPGGKSGL